MGSSQEASFFVEREELLGLLRDAVSPGYAADNDTGYTRICKIVCGSILKTPTTAKLMVTACLCLRSLRSIRNSPSC